MISDALIDNQFRYWLTRTWSDSGVPHSRICWIMLNPSTADDSQDDPTIRRCISFSDGWGFDSLTVVNLYSLRATNPKELLTATYRTGPDNFKYVQEAIQFSQCTLAAWGAFKLGVPDELKGLLQQSNMYCLGKTKEGHPKHPLYIKATTERQRFIL